MTGVALRRCRRGSLLHLFLCHQFATESVERPKASKDVSMDEQQMDGEDKIALRRRSFLRLLAAGGSAAAASAAPLGGHAAADTLSYDERRGPLYRETEEVKTFYRVNRYPTQ